MSAAPKAIGLTLANRVLVTLTEAELAALRAVIAFHKDDDPASEFIPYDAGALQGLGRKLAAAEASR